MLGMQRIIVRNKAGNRFLFAVKTLTKDTKSGQEVKGEN